MLPGRVLLVVSRVDAYRDYFAAPRPDFETHVAPTAGAALDFLAEKRPDVLVLDLEGSEIPAVHLLHVARRLRRGVVSVLLSPSPSGADAAIVAEGVFYYGERPVDPAVLEPVLAAALNAASARDARERIGGAVREEAT